MNKLNFHFYYFINIRLRYREKISSRKKIIFFLPEKSILEFFFSTKLIQQKHITKEVISLWLDTRNEWEKEKERLREREFSTTQKLEKFNWRFETISLSLAEQKVPKWGFDINCSVEIISSLITFRTSAGNSPSQFRVEGHS